MPSYCRDRELRGCSGRAYQRKGWATWLCRRHWHQFLYVLSYREKVAASVPPPAEPRE